MINTNNFNLDTEELALLSEVLKLYLTNKIEPIAFDIAMKYNVIAITIIKKLSKHQTEFTADDLHVMAMALLNFQANIDDARTYTDTVAIDPDTDKYLSMSSSILDMIETLFNAHGISLYS